MVKLSLKQEKYLKLIKLEQSKQVQMGLSNINDDFLKLIECEDQLEMIDTVLQVRALSN